MSTATPILNTDTEPIEYLPIDEWIKKYGRPEPGLDADGIRVFGVMPFEFSEDDE